MYLLNHNMHLQAVVLMSPTNYDLSNYQPAPMVTDYIVPPSSIALLSELPGVAAITMTAQYPIMQMQVNSTEVPVQVSLEAFNPCIPLDSQNSGIPIVYFNYTVTNPTSGAIDVTMLGSQQNIAGWDGYSPVTDEILCGLYGGNTNSLLSVNGMTAINMNNPTLQVG